MRCMHGKNGMLVLLHPTSSGHLTARSNQGLWSFSPIMKAVIDTFKTLSKKQVYCHQLCDRAWPMYQVKVDRWKGLCTYKFEKFLDKLALLH